MIASIHNIEHRLPECKTCNDQAHNWSSQPSPLSSKVSSSQGHQSDHNLDEVELRLGDHKLVIQISVKSVVFYVQFIRRKVVEECSSLHCGWPVEDVRRVPNHNQVTDQHPHCEPTRYETHKDLIIILCNISWSTTIYTAHSVIPYDSNRLFETKCLSSASLVLRSVILSLFVCFITRSAFFFLLSAFFLRSLRRFTPYSGSYGASTLFLFSLALLLIDFILFL